MGNKYVTQAAGFLQKLLDDNDPEGFGCACTPDKWKCGPCTAYEQQKPVRAALAVLRSAVSSPLGAAGPLGDEDGGKKV